MRKSKIEVNFTVFEDSSKLAFQIYMFHKNKEPLIFKKYLTFCFISDLLSFQKQITIYVMYTWLTIMQVIGKKILNWPVQEKLWRLQIHSIFFILPLKYMLCVKTTPSVTEDL